LSDDLIMNKRKRVLTVGIVVGILSVMSGMGCAQRGGHQQVSMANTNTACDNAAALPSLRCALVTSSYFDTHGKLWVAWVFSGHVYVSTSSDKGQSFSKSVPVNRVPEKIYAKGENRPKIVVDDKGVIYVSWTQSLAKRFTGHIRFSRSTDGGEHFSEPLTVNDHQEIAGHRFDALAINKMGHVYLAWLDKRDQLAAKKSGGKYHGAALYYAISTDGGQTFQKNKKIIDHSCQCCRVAIAIDTDQLPVVLWRHIFGDNIRDHALVKFNSKNQAGELIRVSHDNWKVDGCPHHGPAISITENNIYHMTWFNNAPERHGLFYARSGDQGRSLSVPLNFGDYQKAAAHPYVLAAGNDVFLIWKEFDGKQATLHAMESHDGGEQWTAPRQLAKTEGPSDHPFLLSDGQTVYATWHRRGQDYQLVRVASLRKGP